MCVLVWCARICAQEDCIAFAKQQPLTFRLNNIIKENVRVCVCAFSINFVVVAKLHVIIFEIIGKVAASIAFNDNLNINRIKEKKKEIRPQHSNTRPVRASNSSLTNTETGQSDEVSTTMFCFSNISRYSLQPL